METSTTVLTGTRWASHGKWHSSICYKGGKAAQIAASFRGLAAPARDELTVGIDQAGVHSASSGMVLYGDWFLL